MGTFDHDIRRHIMKSYAHRLRLPSNKCNKHIVNTTTDTHEAPELLTAAMFQYCWNDVDISLKVLLLGIVNVLIFKRLRATAGQGPNYVGPSCGYVGLCWPHVDPWWAKRSEKWEQQKNTVKRRIFWWSAAYLGAMLAHRGAMLAYLEGNVGPSWGYLGPSWGLCWPILGLCWPILGLSWPILGAMLPHAEAMLVHLAAYVGPCWPILSHKGRKMGKNVKSTKHRKTWEFLATRGRTGMYAVGRRQGRPPLSYGEERNAYGKDTARGALAGFKRLRATAGQGPNYVGPSCGYVGLGWLSLELCWPSLGLCWPILRPMLAHVAPCGAKRSEKWETAKKHCKTQDILMVGGLSWGYVGPSWGYVGPSWGQCGPILRPMLAHVDPSWATSSEKWENKRRALRDGPGLRATAPTA